MIGNIREPSRQKLVCEKSKLCKIQGISKMSEIHAACSVQNNVEDVEDIKTSYNRVLTDFLEFISLLLETYIVLGYHTDTPITMKAEAKP